MSHDVNDMPHHLRSPSGLTVQVNRNGSIRRMDHGDVILNMYVGSEIEGGPTNLYLRRHGTPIEWTPLLGPRSPGAIRLDAAGLEIAGEWRQLRFALRLVLAESAPAWLWHVRLENLGATSVRVDLVYAQDFALADYGAIRMNEYYVSQYVDYTPLVHAERGHVLAVRQNLAVGDHYPWALVGAFGRGVGFATDALDLHGLATRAGERPPALAAPVLATRRRQHEHSMAAIQDAPVAVAPGAVVERGFFGWFVPNHHEASSDADLACVERALALPEAAAPARGRASRSGTPPATTLFSSAPVLESDDLGDAELTTLFGPERRHIESEDGAVLSFFTGAHRHVVLKTKERRSLRPHGHIIRTGAQLAPDEESLTSTAWMSGVFHSLVTQGHVNINRVLSTVRSYLGLVRSGGLRIFVELEDGYRLLGIPSAFAMTPSGCQWVYKYPGGIIQVVSGGATTRHALTLALDVLAGPPRRFLLSHHVAFGGDDGAEPVPVRWEQDADGIVVRTVPDTDLGRRFPQGFFRFDPQPVTAIERVAGDEALFADGRSRRQPFLVVATRPVVALALQITGGLIPAPASPASVASSDEPASDEGWWRDMAGRVTLQLPPGPAAASATRLHDMLPWLAHDALIHYLAPRGLEQYSGGGWGTRDVSQGPVEWLLALGRWDPLRDLLVRVFAAQNPDGDWPQWFTFFARERGIRAADSHGDIVFWPLLALAQYLLASEDGDLLAASVPFFHPDGAEHAETATILAHVERALAAVARRQIPDTSLVAYGHGDWNDSLQPVDPAMRERLCSSWTVTLQFQTATTLAAALRRLGHDEIAARLHVLATRTHDDFQRMLMPDATLAGFAYFKDGGDVEYLLHPRDNATGIRYRLLPMIHAVISGLLTPEQARTHVGYIRDHLLAPDGARLFDRPPQYRGGRQRIFQRAESSSFFGREIGLMYVHAHLRYAEAMARLGDAEAFYRALLQATPIGIREVVPNTRPRQANCYASSSDAAFADRYEAQEHYEDVRAGRVPLEAGWRIYSSGAGIAFRLIHECLIGVRRGKSSLTIDPVLPRALDGLAVDLDLAGRPVRLAYEIADQGCGPVALVLNGSVLPFAREPNAYRRGGAVVSMMTLRERLGADGNRLTVRLG